MNRKDSKNKRIARVLALILAVAMILSTAFYLMMFIGTLIGADLNGGYAYGAESITFDIDGMDLSEQDKSRLENLPQIMRFVKQVYKDDISFEELIQGLYTGMFQALDDEWSEYYFKGDSTTEDISLSLDNEFYGVGVMTAKTDAGFTVLGVTEGSPAQEAGIQAGGILVKVDGKDITQMTQNELVLHIRGEKGTTVKLEISYPTGIKTYILERRKITSPSVTSKMLDDTTAYIDINSFSAATAKEFKNALKSMKALGMDRAIIDLRSNSGGYVDPAWDIASLLIPKGISGYYVAQGEVVQTFQAKGSEYDQLPLVVLINENSASAAELLSLALKDAQRAVFVGEVSYGKGVGQGVYTVKNDDTFKLSQIYYTGRNQKPIHGEGIVPDHIVYTYGGYTASQANEMVNGMVSLVDDQRYYQGEEGLNVLGAQQRLICLGYKQVQPTGILDDATMDALRKVQRAAGSYSYGNLDSFTIKALREQFNALLGFGPDGTHQDAQLAKAQEVIKTMK